VKVYGSLRQWLKSPTRTTENQGRIPRWRPGFHYPRLEHLEERLAPANLQYADFNGLTFAGMCCGTRRPTWASNRMLP